jgi:hypothetical protein
VSVHNVDTLWTDYLEKVSRSAACYNKQNRQPRENQNKILVPHIRLPVYQTTSHAIPKTPESGCRKIYRAFSGKAITAPTAILML